MNKILIALTLGFSATLAHADIPAPPSDDVTEITVVGDDANEMMDAIVGQEKTEYALRTNRGVYKVWRSTSGNAQIVCTGNYKLPNPNGRTNTRCTVQKGGDGQKVPEFRPHRIMG